MINGREKRLKERLSILFLKKTILKYKLLKQCTRMKFIAENISRRNLHQILLLKLSFYKFCQRWFFEKPILEEHAHLFSSKNLLSKGLNCSIQKISAERSLVLAKFSVETTPSADQPNNSHNSFEGSGWESHDFVLVSVF